MNHVEFIENSHFAMCVLLRFKSINCLLDFGIKKGDVENVLRNINYIFITHEHLDHCNGLQFIPPDLNVPICANEKTRKAIVEKFPITKRLNWNIFETGSKFTLGALSISTLFLNHDSAENVSFKISNDDVTTTYMVDLGSYSLSELRFCDDADNVIIESYYDEAKTSKNNNIWKHRLSGRYGHLSQQQANDFCDAINANGLHKIILCHDFQNKD